MVRALVVAVVLVATVAVPARADFTVALDTPNEVFPTGFAGDGVLVTDGRGVLLVRPGATTRVLRADRLWSAVGSATRVAAYLGTEGASIAVAHADDPPYQDPEVGVSQGPFTVVAGGVGAPLREIARCGARVGVTVVPAVVAGDAVAWRDCDTRAVAVDVGGRRSRLDTAGTVVALASAGTRLVWITAHDGAPALLERADPGTGERTVLGELPALGTAPSVELRATSDGRVRATFTVDAGGSEEPRCDLFDAAPDAAPVPSASHDCAWRDITASPGSVGPTTARLRLAPTRIVARDEQGASRRLVQGRRGAEPQFTVADDRVAWVARTCVGRTVTDTTLATAPPAAPLIDCPVRLVSRRVRADRRGRFTVRLACADGCDSLTLSSSSRLRKPVAPGGTGTVPVRLGPRSREALRRRGSLRVRVRALGPDGRVRDLGDVTVRR